MGSLKYEISQHCKALMQTGVSSSGKHTTPKRWKAYMDSGIKLGEWCKRTYRCRHLEDCRPHIQDYTDWLVQQGLSASTVHTYLAGICRIFEVPMDKVQKPKRVTAQNTRSRGKREVDDRKDAAKEASPRLHDFATVVGIRRAEYVQLRSNDLIHDESGYLCVQVRRGKGGKYQLQRILSGDEVLVRSYFDSSEARVFVAKELNNKLDLHHLRAVQAQRAYQYYCGRLCSEPEYRLQMEEEIKARWRLHNKRRWRQHEFGGSYRLRGANRELARRLGRPTEYDRLAVMATSVFHLSHWRCDVTVSNYLLAY